MTQLKRHATYQYGTLVPEPRRRGPDIWVYRFFENRTENEFDGRFSSARWTNCRSVRMLSGPVKTFDCLQTQRLMRAPRRCAASLIARSKKCSNHASMCH